MSRDRPSRYDFATVHLRFGGPSGALGRARARLPGGGREPCAGRLYLPDRPRDPPVVVLAPGAGMRWRFGLDAVAERYAAGGVAAFVFDYRDWGDSRAAADGSADAADDTAGDDRPPLVDPGRQIADLRAAVGAVRDLDDVDGSRVGLWGIDLSAAHALAVAASDPGIGAVVARAPATRARLLQGGRRARLGGLLAGAADRLTRPLDRLGVPFVGGRTVPLVSEEDEPAVVAAPGAESAFRDLLPAGSTWTNETPARSLWRLRGHDVSARLRDVGCPTLFVAGSRDRVVRSDAVERASERVADSTLVRLPVGHWETFGGEAAGRVLGHELAFLESEL